jgi:hypothetical protein
MSKRHKFEGRFTRVRETLVLVNSVLKDHGSTVRFRVQALGNTRAVSGLSRRQMYRITVLAKEAV